MEYIPLKSMAYYDECAPLVEGLGYILVELKITSSGSTKKISAVIESKDAGVDIGVNDCAKVHHALLPRLEALLGTEDTYMELTSPGMERNIKNAAEFAVFTGREIRVWDKTVTDWVSGVITASDEKSVTLEKDGEKITVPFEQIAKAKFIHI
ncbi:ribosome maturation factor RimP [uncultured Treponema sp.]|uniref:ribosome maturation factor RimP n=1 Tax=uncultured Treponema sp. TaxID=162155 RepID=UPI002594ACC4|nr:ribosome maturation factor RimP [uncultured Treponema sp.]